MAIFRGDILFRREEFVRGGNFGVPTRPGPWSARSLPGLQGSLFPPETKSTLPAIALRFNSSSKQTALPTGPIQLEYSLLFNGAFLMDTSLPAGKLSPPFFRLSSPPPRSLGLGFSETNHHPKRIPYFHFKTATHLQLVTYHSRGRPRPSRALSTSSKETISTSF